MQGNFEIVQRTVVVQGNKYVVDGYRENYKGVRTAIATYTNRFGKRSRVENVKLEIAIMRKLELENRKIKNIRKMC